MKSIQCLSARSNDFCWKNLLVPLGEISLQGKAITLLTISGDGTYSGDEIPIITVLPQEIFGCLDDNPHSSKQHVDGTYSASNGLIILHAVHYLVNGSEFRVDEDAIAGSYSATSATLTVTLDLGSGERWKANFTK